MVLDHVKWLCRYQSPIGVGELMHFFDATHTSVNAPPAPTPQDGAQGAARQIKKVKRESSAMSALPQKETQVTLLEPANACLVC